MKTKQKLKADIEAELTNVLNMFVECGFDEDVVLDVIKEEAKKMPYLDYSIQKRKIREDLL